MKNYEPEGIDGHALEIISEGYGLCQSHKSPYLWYAWAFTPPADDWDWKRSDIRGRNDELITAWVTSGEFSREEAMILIQAYIDARRSMPFDEERERARLMPI